MVETRMDELVWLRNQLEVEGNDLLREMVRSFAQGLMSAEADVVCGAPWGQQSPDRVNRRNGYRTRRWDTRVGSIELRIPKLRQGSYFPEWLLDARTRSERAFVQVVTEAYVRGISTRKVEGLVEALGVTSLSKSQVSELARELDQTVSEFRNRPLDADPYTYVWADALVVKCREGGRVVNVALLLAVGVNNEGHREILGLDIATGEDGAAWLGFWRSLVARGLSGVQQCLLRRPRRPAGRHSSDPPRCVVAAVPHPLPTQPVDQGPPDGGGDGGNHGENHLRPA